MIALTNQKAEEIPLERRGNVLQSSKERWEITEVLGPLFPSALSDEREYFLAKTSEQESLLFYRASGEKGMRKLFLVKWKMEGGPTWTS